MRALKYSKTNVGERGEDGVAYLHGTASLNTKVTSVFRKEGHFKTTVSGKQNIIMKYISFPWIHSLNSIEFIKVQILRWPDMCLQWENVGYQKDHLTDVSQVKVASNRRRTKPSGYPKLEEAVKNGGQSSI